MPSPATSTLDRLRALANVGERSLTARVAEALDGCESVLDVGCGRDSVLERLPRFDRTLGVDGHLPAIEDSRARGIHDDYLHADVTRLDLAPESFDAVIAFDLIEHLTKEQGLELLARAASIARRSVVVFTPNGEVAQDEYDGNPLQVHRSGWVPADFEREGFVVHGMKGLRQLRGEESTPRRPQALARVALSLSQPVVERRAHLAYSLLAVKRL